MLILGLNTLIHICTPPLFEVGFEVLHRKKPAKLSEKIKNISESTIELNLIGRF